MPHATTAALNATTLGARPERGNTLPVLEYPHALIADIARNHRGVDLPMLKYHTR